MSQVQLLDGQILLNSGLVALDPACCCDNCPICGVASVTLDFSGSCTTGYDGTYGPLNIHPSAPCAWESTYLIGGVSPFLCDPVIDTESYNAGVSCVGPLTTGGPNSERAYISAEGILIVRVNESPVPSKMRVTIFMQHSYVTHRTPQDCAKFDAGDATWQAVQTVWEYDFNSDGTGQTFISRLVDYPSGWALWAGDTLDSISVSFVAC